MANRTRPSSSSEKACMGLPRAKRERADELAGAFSVGVSDMLAGGLR